MLHALKICPDCDFPMRMIGELEWYCPHCDIKAYEKVRKGKVYYEKHHIPIEIGLDASNVIPFKPKTK